MTSFLSIEITISLTFGDYSNVACFYVWFYNSTYIIACFIIGQSGPRNDSDDDTQWRRRSARQVKRRLSSSDGSSDGYSTGAGE